MVSETPAKEIETFSNGKMQLIPSSTESKPSTLPLFSPSSKFLRDKRGLARRRRWLVVDFDGTVSDQNDNRYYEENYLYTK